MDAIYSFVTGPLAWFTFIVFVCGSLWKITGFWMRAMRRDVWVIAYWNWKYALRSIFAWAVPFKSQGWKSRPWLTAVTFPFHIFLILVPVFLSAHILMWEQYFNVSWAALPDGIADGMSIAVLGGCVFLAIRRMKSRTLQLISSPQDWVILGIIAGTFLFGILAYHQIGAYKLMLTVHVLFGEAFLIMIPFSRVSHMLTILFTRGYMGSEFGAVRHARDW